MRDLDLSALMTSTALKPEQEFCLIKYQRDLDKISTENITPELLDDLKGILLQATSLYMKKDNAIAYLVKTHD